MRKLWTFLLVLALIGSALTARAGVRFITDVPQNTIQGKLPKDFQQRRNRSRAFRRLYENQKFLRRQGSRPSLSAQYADVQGVLRQGIQPFQRILPEPRLKAQPSFLRRNVCLRIRPYL